MCVCGVGLASHGQSEKIAGSDDKCILLGFADDLKFAGRQREVFYCIGEDAVKTSANSKH